MLPSYLGKPSGQETGDYMALDFGGTNVRVLLVRLKGKEGYEIISQKSLPLRDPLAGYDLTSPVATAEELFDFLAVQLGSLVSPGRIYPLGHTFSFPSLQSDLNSARLITWTKEIKTHSVEGQDINQLLFEALRRQKLHHIIQPKVILNDTVATLVAASFEDPLTYVGSICGTGHNTCYLEPKFSRANSPMIINIESGNFDQLPFTPFDELLTRATAKPFEQRLEKMVSGSYIGEIVRLIVSQLIEQGLLFAASKIGSSSPWLRPYAINARSLSPILADNTPELTGVDEWLVTCGNPESSLEERKTIRSIASLVTTRSARLVAATYIGIVRHLDALAIFQHNIAIDGSLYEKLPGYAQNIALALREAGLADQVTARLYKNGSGIGAAIAAAIDSKPID